MFSFSFVNSDFLVKMRLKFYSKIRFNEKTTCWEWIGRIDKDGYGKFGFFIFNSRAYVISLLLHGFTLNQELVIDHLCRNKACCNPEHLEQVTQKENSLRGLGGYHNLLKTHCKNGHEFTPQNTYINENKRVCKTCNRNRCRKYAQNKSTKQYAEYYY